jgi:hypothetical protein
MQLGDSTADVRTERCPLDAALDDAQEAVSKMLGLLEVGSLQRHTAAEKINFWQLDDLLKRAGIAQTSDGTQLSSDQLLRIADEADIWPTIIDKHGVPWRWDGRDGSPAAAKPWH